MKILQLEHTSCCCDGHLYDIPRQQAIPLTSGFIEPGLLHPCIHNAHPPPCGSFLVKMTGATWISSKIIII